MTMSIASKTGIVAIAAAATTVASTAAMAHTGGGIASGFAHPFTGLDHVLAMLAVGLWAGLAGGRLKFAAPAAFVLFLVAGAGLAAAGIVLPGVETGIAASLIVVGLLIASAATLTPWLGAATVGAFAIFHGAAHGAALAATGLAGLLGLIAATVLLHVAGLGLAGVLRRSGAATVARLAGAVGAAAGLVATLS